jgi:Cu-Zn family superoxide dismutase
MMATAMVLGGCTAPVEPSRTAWAVIEARSGSSAVGSAEFEDDGQRVTLTLKLMGLSPGPHGVHLHATGDCSSPDASSAGGHWMANGSTPTGDLGSLMVGEDGRASLTYTSKQWSVLTLSSSRYDLLGHAIVVHEGDAGARIGCGVIELGAQKVGMATLSAKSGSMLAGSAVLVAKEGGQTTLRVSVSGTSPGAHGLHLHQMGDCTAADGTSAGGHWNPANVAHGQPGSGAHHAGDIGNLVVDNTGLGTLSYTSDSWTIGSGDPNTDVIDHALIIHAALDDLSQPVGNAGGRIACGVVVPPTWP